MIWEPSECPTSLMMTTLTPLADSVVTQRTELWPRPALKAVMTRWDGDAAANGVATDGVAANGVAANAVAAVAALDAAATPAAQITEMMARAPLKRLSQHVVRASFYPPRDG